MKGALVGDCAGSFWENSYNKIVQKEWWVPACHFTDDSICTIATMRWLLSSDHSAEHYGTILREMALPFINRGFASKFRDWANTPDAPAYESWGNGSMMRVSPVALWASTEEEALSLAELSALPTHNSEEAIKGAIAVTWALWNTLRGMPSDQVLYEVQSRFGYEVVDYNPELKRQSLLFDVSAKGTAPLALAIGLKAKSFDLGMNWCYSMGGDADTLGAISGPFLEARFGIPKQHWENTESRFQEHPELFQWVALFYKKLEERHQHLMEHLNKSVPATGPVIKASKYKIFSTDML